MLESLLEFLTGTGIWQLFFKAAEGEGMFSLADQAWAFDVNCWQTVVMMIVSFVLIYLAIGKKFEPLLLLPIAIGMLLTNLPGAGMFHLDFFIGETVDYMDVLYHGGLLDLLYLGVMICFTLA